MTGQAHSGSAFLRQLPVGRPSGGQMTPYRLLWNQEVVIGREASCQIILDSNTYTGVSRRHAAVRPLASGLWEICDLNSGNGTYINGQRLQGCQTLQAGDRISLGQNGAEFIFESQNAYNANQSSPPPGTPYPPATAGVSPQPVPSQPDSEITLTKLFPIFSTGRDLRRKGFLIPGIITVVTVVALFAAIGSSFLAFLWILAVYLAGAAFYFVYQLCGKPKPWWLLVASAVTTFIILQTPIFHLISVIFALPAYVLTGMSLKQTLSSPHGTSLTALFISFFFNAGLREEFTKALPVLGAYLIGRRLSSPKRELIGVWEPLDGILLGAASSVGFTLCETLLQYIPEAVRQGGAAIGIALLIPRILGEIAGHMAWSGYFGYFIGLSVLNPRKAWQFLGIGYLTVALLHALWDTFSDGSNLVLVILGVLSYAFLAAAILKARTLSPTRAQNFATRFLK